MGTIPMSSNSGAAITPYSPYGLAIRGDSNLATQVVNYGGSALDNYVQAQGQAVQGGDAYSSGQSLAKLSTASIRYSPETATTKRELILNAYGYAQKDIQSMGGQNGSIDEATLATQLGADAASKFMKAEDLDGDGKITAKEHTNYILMSDNAPQIMGGTYNAFAQTPGSIPGADPTSLSDMGNQLSSITSKTDGQITADERMAAEFAVTNSPTMTKTTLQQLNDTLNVSGTIDQALGQTPSGGQAV